MKLGLIYEPRSANAHYRGLIPLRALERRGHTVVWPTRITSLPIEAFLTCDLVHCYRRLDRLEDLRRLSRRGVAISFDNDDDFAVAEASPWGKGLEGRRHNLEMFGEILQAARLADATTTPNGALAERYRAAGVEHVTVIENYLARDAFGFGASAKHDGVVVGWVAGREHKLDLERLPIVSTLTRLLEEHSALRVISVGLRLPLHSERYEHIKDAPFGDLLKVVGRFDIGIAPLADTPFNRSRSSVKLKEYGAGRAMWLASPVGPYRALGERQGGMLVGDQEWFDALDGMIRSPRRRRRLARRALKWARAQTIERHAASWERVFSDAVERAAQRNQVSPDRCAAGAAGRSARP
jgi:hypothetical protein